MNHNQHKNSTLKNTQYTKNRARKIPNTEAPDLKIHNTKTPESLTSTDPSNSPFPQSYYHSVQKLLSPSTSIRSWLLPSYTFPVHHSQFVLSSMIHILRWRKCYKHIRLTTVHNFQYLIYTSVPWQSLLFHQFRSCFSTGVFNYVIKKKPMEGI